MTRNKTYYQQHAWGDGPAYRPATLTVGDLIDQLSPLDRDLPVIFRSPLSGCYGPRQHYAVDTVERETLTERQEHHPASIWFNEETGEDVPQEAYTDEFSAWDGVVIS